MPMVTPLMINRPDSRAVATANAPAWLGVFGRFFWLLALPVVVACIYLSFVHSLVLIGERAEVSASGSNGWLDTAEQLDIVGIPDIYEAKGSFLHRQGVLLSDEARSEMLMQSAAYWDRAAEIRPDWPYYPLSALSAEIAYNAPAERIQMRLDQLMHIAPNERGLYRNLFRYAFIAWEKLRADQQRWIIRQVQLPGGDTFNRAIKAARSVNRMPLLCATLPWSVAKDICY
ncbi:hypothetical protein [Oceanobacter sp. 3_MG-2023]|uniref:hypothetical protein n=1 Tax=Oceanobacter sp. 3_MG-2023 TaxID=3062622 RepID=UPI0027373563|nr:hypothetical protein [Oceanobacter sp. 3_MG-2023]MDP2505053.1 hypothetical protein [Oceanobacter sp. 3_MG-2023]